MLSDPNWNEGNYYGGPIPASGLAVARSAGVPYMSELWLNREFGRNLQ